MDIMIPFLGRITRLDVQHKGAFHVAGVKDDKVEKVRNDRKRIKEQRGQETLLDDKDKKGKEDNPHLDIWV
ncbi:hypothetical protein [Pseudoalteromonas sp. GB56]